MIPDLDRRLNLAGQILCLLREHPEGFFEYQLIQLLKARHSAHISHRELVDRLALFRIHFLPFNALYHLRDHLWVEHEVYLEISPLSLCLYLCADGTQTLEQGDPLRDHYPDLRHLGETSKADAERLLQSFWTCMQGNGEKATTLALFELEGAANYPAAELCYRQLASQHHPDCGGSTVRLRSINKTMGTLQRYYNRS